MAFLYLKDSDSPDLNEQVYRDSLQGTENRSQLKENENIWEKGFNIIKYVIILQIARHGHF